MEHFVPVSYTHLCDKYNLPRMVYVTEMDMDDASFRQVVEDLTVRYGKKIAPHFQPIRENEKLVGYINIIKNAGKMCIRDRIIPLWKSGRIYLSV